MDATLVVVCPHCDTLNRLPRAKLGEGGRCGSCGARLFDGRPLPLDAARFERFLAKSDVPLLIDFWAPWCRPCHAMAPEFERAARELEPGIKLVKIDTDAEPGLAQRFAVQSIPTIVLALHGRELGRIVGARSAGQLVRWAAARGAA
jgi:thioredoxin 2